VGEISGVVREREHIHFVPRSYGLQLVEGADFITFVRGIGDAVAKVENSHGLVKNW
jgi:hypothetical protein